MLRQEFTRRHSPNRRKTQVEARIEVDGRRQRAIILDVSYEGMKLSISEDIPPGTAITVEVFGERIPAIVHWSRTRFAGLHLLERLKRDTLVALETAHDDLKEYR